MSRPEKKLQFLLSTLLFIYRVRVSPDIGLQSVLSLLGLNKVTGNMLSADAEVKLDGTDLCSATKRWKEMTTHA